MLPGVGLTEMILIVVLALVLVGPKDLPLMMRKIGKFTGKVRQLAFEFRQSFDELGRQAELEELRKEVADLKKSTGIAEMDKEIREDSAKMQREMSDALSDSANEMGKGAAATPPVADAALGESGSAPEIENRIGGADAEAADVKAKADDAKAEAKAGKAKDPADKPKQDTPA